MQGSSRRLVRSCLVLLGSLLVAEAIVDAAEPGQHRPILSFAPFLDAPPPTIRCVSVTAVEPVSEEKTASSSTQEPRSAGPTSSQPDAGPFAGVSELSADSVVQQVLARNPTVAQMVAAWHAALARYPQVTSLDDPMFAGTIGPDTIAPDDQGIRFAWRVEVSQKYPWPGKLALRGANAQAEAHAAGHDVDDTRLQLAESARDAFFDYYLAARALEVNEENLKLLREFRQNAETRYKTGVAPQQDILQASVEIGRQEERQLTLERMRQVAVARLNTLLHLAPDLPLPPPPKELTVGDALPDAGTLRAAALTQRPDLQAVRDHLAAEQASLGLAHKEFYPDLEPFLMYDRFMGNMPENRDLATMVGVRVNVPVRTARRCGAVAEAEARIEQRRAELDRQLDQVNFDVQQAYEQVQESERIVRLYDQKVLPDAQAHIKAAQSAYVTGQVPFLSLVEAERNQVGLRDRYHEAVAEYFRRRAALERAVGGPLPAVADPVSGQPGRAPSPGRQGGTSTHSGRLTSSLQSSPWPSTP